MRPRTLVHPNYGTFTAWTTTPAADKPEQTSASAFSQLQRQYYGPLQIVDAGNSSLNCTLPLALNISKPLNLLVASLPAASGGAAPGQSSA
ncbi:hypothetical protein PCASD_13377 [Puccinia coronata f. sp. avenae]|uniref:Uncharacterized protein n=1 Tax=Puccinia coronata f. sp. avenae TaxID=200324 RepID=A0A2N5TZ70_9BASI|nr:hypothetical protein PCASD_13377 [Puccinia coronata f. sp. avenae]